MDLADFAWREVLVVALAIAGIYLVVALMGLWRMRPRRPPVWPAAAGLADPLVPPLEPRLREAPTKPGDRPAQELVEIDVAGLQSGMQPYAADRAAPELVEIDLGPAPAAEVRPRPREAATEGPSFAEHLAVTELAAEVRQLREELRTLREEVAAIKEAPRVSPLYADAAELARRGFDARGVAAECGISVAEAELVLALSRSDRDFDKGLGEIKGDRNDDDIGRVRAANSA